MLWKKSLSNADKLKKKNLVSDFGLPTHQDGEYLGLGSYAVSN